MHGELTVEEHTPINQALILLPWHGELKIPRLEVLSWYLDILIQSGVEMVRIPFNCASGS